MKTNIELHSDYGALQKIHDVLESRGLVTIDLEHLPFNEFDYVVKVDTKDLDKDRMRAKFPALTEKVFEDIYKTFVEKTAHFTRHKVTIKDKTIHILDGSLGLYGHFKGNVTFNTNNCSLSDIFEDIDIDTSNLSESAARILKDTDEEAMLRPLIQILMDILSYLVYMQLPKEYHDIIAYEPKANISVGTKKKKGSKKTNVTYIKNVVYNPVVNEPKYTEFMDKRPYTRHTESWYTRGFWRTYKSGKQTWIEPTVKKAKGSNAATVINQVYKVL